MRDTSSPDEAAIAEGSGRGLGPRGATFTVVVAYEDQLTWEWARLPVEYVSRLAGGLCVRARAYRIDDLTHPPLLREAVLAATRADLIVTAFRGAEILPTGLSMWVVGWLARRRRREGVLMALLGTSPESEASSQRTLEYLGAVARRAGLEFMAQERPVSTPSPKAGGTDSRIDSKVSDPLVSQEEQRPVESALESVVCR